MQPLNNEPFKLLKDYKDETLSRYDKVNDMILPLIVEDLKQLRDLTKDIIIISGAIASFTIPILNTSIVQTKSFAYTALFLLFSTMIYAIYHLTELIPKELTSLSRQQEVYSKVIVGNITRINRVLEDGNIDHLKEIDENDSLNQLNSLKIENKPDNSLNILRFLLGLSLTFIILSLFNYSFLLLIVSNSLLQLPF